LSKGVRLDSVKITRHHFCRENLSASWINPLANDDKRLVKANDDLLMG
jgi:hypothetical protein